MISRQTARSFGPAGIVFLVALLTRVFVLYQISSDPQLNHVGGDGAAYLQWASSIPHDGWIGTQIFYASPLYPYLVAIFQKIFGVGLLRLLAAQAVIGAAGCGLLAMAARKLFDAHAGIVAGLMLALYPAAISYDLQVDKTVLDCVLVAGVLWVIASLIDRPTVAKWIGCGALIGIFSLTRENAIALLVPLAAWSCWHFRASPLRRLAIWMASLGLGVACVVFPVCLRNSLIGGQFYLSTAKFGANFYYGNSAVADGIYFPLRPGRGDLRYEQQDATELAEAAIGRHLTLSEVSSYWTHRTLHEMAADPIRWTRLSARKFAMFWCDAEIADADVHDRHIVLSSILNALDHIWGFGFLFPIALAGAVLRWRRPAVSLLLLLTFTYSVAIAAFILFGRYRLPVVPMLIPLAAGALCELPEIFRKRKWKPLTLAIAVAAIGICIVVIGDACIPDRIRGTNFYNRAIVYASRGENDLAISQYQKAIASNRTLESAYVNLSLLLANRRDFQQAESIARVAIHIDPRNAAAHVNLGLVLAESGRIAIAFDQFSQAVSLDPQNRAARFNLAAAMLAQNKSEQAIPILTDLATTEPADDIALRAQSLLRATSAPK